MRKFFGLIATLALVACGGGSKYTISGRIAGLVDGDPVILCAIVDGTDLAPVDTAYVKGGKYSFKGETDGSEVYIMSFDNAGQMATCTFFLEPGNIKLDWDGQNQTVGGTQTNKSFQKFYDEVTVINNDVNELYSRMAQAQQEGADLESYRNQMEDLQNSYLDLVKRSILENSNNMFGVQQLADNYDMYSTEELNELLEGMGPDIANDIYIVQLKEMVAMKMRTTKGNPFVDFTVKKPAGSGLEDARFSELLAGSKMVLLDFWASWCAPCRNEIPTMKEAYAKFHDKGLQIVSVSVDEDQDDWREAMEQEQMPWIQLIDLRENDEAPTYTYSISTIPATFMIQDGKIIETNLRGEELIRFLEENL